MLQWLLWLGATCANQITTHGLSLNGRFYFSVHHRHTKVYQTKTSKAPSQFQALELFFEGKRTHHKFEKDIKHQNHYYSLLPIYLSPWRHLLNLLLLPRPKSHKPRLPCPLFPCTIRIPPCRCVTLSSWSLQACPWPMPWQPCDQFHGYKTCKICAMSWPLPWIC